jgi:hypothetical protein
MKSLALQNLVKKIFSDEKAKSQFIADPESIISRFDLTDQERKAVLTTHARLGLVTSGSTQLTSTIGPLANWS